MCPSLTSWPLRLRWVSIQGQNRLSSIVEDRDRNVIPRWRPLSTTIQLGELDSRAHSPRTPQSAGPGHDERRQNWIDSGTWIAASEFVGASLSVGRHDEARDAALQVVGADNVPLGALLVARRALNLPTDHQALSIPSESHTAIQMLKRRVLAEPKNPFTFCELARHYTILGQPLPAYRAMMIATKLAPKNRYVLRVGARFFLHIGHMDHAHDLLRRSKVVSEDPWVLAAEIAVGMAAGKTSTNVRNAMHMVSSSSFSRYSVSELHSALGTLDLNSGNVRFAKRRFKSALEQPTENSVAQAAWADRKIGGIEIPPDTLLLPRSYEAQMWHHVSQKEWNSAFDSSQRWLDDQPFSSRPAIQASYMASVAIGDFGACVRIAERGLIANPNDPILLNNLIVGLALSGRVAEANTRLPHLAPLLEALEDSCTHHATTGLVRFREDNAEEGRRQYALAVQSAEAQGQPKQRLLAKMFWAREEKRIDPTGSLKLVQETLAEARTDHTGELEQFIHELEGSQPPTPKPSDLDLRKWLAESQES